MSANLEKHTFDSLGLSGGDLVTGTYAKTGDYFCIYPLADATITFTSGNITNFASGSYTAGIPIYGRFSVVRGTAGTVILYNY